jgi:hypothetical protein
MVKTPEELRRLRTAAEITERAMNAAFALIKPGVTEAEIVREIPRRPMTPAPRSDVCSGLDGVPAHRGVAEARRRDLLRYDIGCTTVTILRGAGDRSSAGHRPASPWDAMVAGWRRPSPDPFRCPPAEIHAAPWSPGAWSAWSTTRFHCGHGIGVLSTTR